MVHDMSEKIFKKRAKIVALLKGPRKIFFKYEIHDSLDLPDTIRVGNSHVSSTCTRPQGRMMHEIVSDIWGTTSLLISFAEPFQATFRGTDLPTSKSGKLMTTDSYHICDACPDHDS